MEGIVSPDTSGTRARRKLHVRVGLAFVRTLRPALYVLLFLSAVLALWSGGPLFGLAAPSWARSLAPALFAVFLVVFSIYRIALVRAKRYPAATALFHIGLGALVWVLLLPGVRLGLLGPQAGEGDAVPALITAGDPRVRALAVEVASLRPNRLGYVPLLLERLDDEDPAVRAAARQALAAIAGVDVAVGLPDPAAAGRWREEARTRGWTH